MAVYTINQTLQVVYLKDGKPYPCNVGKVDEENAKIEVHFINWNEKYNEWIEFGSIRNVDQNDNSPTFSNCQQCVQIKEIIGMLLTNSNQVQKKDISAFRESEDTAANEKCFSEFTKNMLEDTAEYFGLRCVDSENIKIFTKKSLIKHLICKIKALLLLLGTL